MTLEEAITILDLWVNNKPVIPQAKLHVAVRLGLEASKYTLKIRQPRDPVIFRLLPGETES